MMKTLFACLVMVCPMILSAADNPRVLMVRGNVSVQQHGKTEAARTGLNLEASAVVEVGPSGYIAMLKGGSGVVELSSPGTYKVDAQFASLRKTATTQRIASYLYANAYGNRSTGTETGTVYRTQTIGATWPPNTVVDTTVITVRWNALRNYTGGYILRLMTDSDSTVKEIRTTDTLVTLDLPSVAGSYRGTCLYWTVTAVSDTTISSQPRCIHWATDGELRAISTQVSEMLSIYTLDQTVQMSPLQGMLLGALYEEQGYYDRALDYYAKGRAGAEVPETTMLYEFCAQRGRE